MFSLNINDFQPPPEVESTKRRYLEMLIGQAAALYNPELHELQRCGAVRQRLHTVMGVKSFNELTYAQLLEAIKTVQNSINKKL